MEEVIEDDGIDLEELQAQIDLEMARTQALVASWVDPKYVTPISKEEREKRDKEIDELLKRPPRLGVGATVPTSSGSTGHDTIKLRDKLAGKKRAREEEPTPGPSQSDEEEESRAGAIRKKARVDPFAQKQKGKKKAVQTPASPPIKSASERVKTPESKEKPPVRPAASAPAVSGSIPSGLASSPEVSTKKKRKKKKNKHNAPVTSQIPNPKAVVVLSDDDEPPQPREVIIIDDTPPHTPESKSKAAARSSLVAERAKTPERKKSSTSSETFAIGLPLLNLDGPPPSVPLTPSKKKRRRKKKKKHDHPDADDAMDVDVQENPLKHPDDDDAEDEETPQVECTIRSFNITHPNKQLPLTYRPGYRSFINYSTSPTAYLIQGLHCPMCSHTYDLHADWSRTITSYGINTINVRHNVDDCD